MQKDLVIHPNDNVAIALQTTETHMRGHKYALKDFDVGDAIIKYGMPIGSATKAITKGAHIHVHNMTTNLGDMLNYTYAPTISPVTTPFKNRTVKVYERLDHKVGIRNEIWIIPTVGCVNGVSQQIIDRFKSKLMDDGVNLNKLPYCDGVFAFPHPYGCSQMGDDHDNTKATLQNIVKHPNAGGVLVVGLGCENNQIDPFKDSLGDYDTDRVHFMVAQNEADEIDAGVAHLESLLAQMAKDVRVEKPIEVLNVGLECGGSDGLSGITANPLVGRFSDFLTFHGGTTVLTEVPEMFGAETILMNRAINQTVFEQTVAMVNDFKQYYKNHNLVIYDNPSPGNKDGGISTLEDKSQGCTTKAGQGPVMDVLKHTERLKTRGLNLISAPGNDAVATTTLGMCGCHMVLFTTGRGNPFGGFIPTVKIATNTPLATNKPNWIDFDAGRLVDGMSMDALLEALIDLVVAVANGEKTRQEINGYREIAIFKSGVTL